MPIVNGYVDLDEFRAWNEIQATTNSAAAERAIEAASRLVDAYCDRAFWPDPAAVRIVDACTPTRIELGAYGDLSAVTAIATDDNGDGTFETAWAPTDYQLLPVGATDPPQSRPYTVIRANGRQFPLPDSTRAGRVQVTGDWGWPAIPTEVAQATLLQASRIYKRRDSPEGVTGFGSEFGAIRLSTKLDPDVKSLLAPFQLEPIKVA